MSRGLSQQQLRILQLGYAFNRELHGGTFTPHITAPAGEKFKPKYAHLHVCESAAPPDLFIWMLPHWICGIPFAAKRTRRRATGWGYQSTSGQYWGSRELNVAKASCSRAAAALWNRGLVAEHTFRVSEFYPIRGYVLTANGAARARDEQEHAPLLSAVIERLTWQSRCAGDAAKHYAEAHCVSVNSPRSCAELTVTNRQICRSLTVTAVTARNGVNTAEAALG